MRHRESWAVEKTSPTLEAFRREERNNASKTSNANPNANRSENPPASKSRPAASTREAGRTIIRRSGKSEGQTLDASVDATPANVPRETLIVASKLKNYVKAISGMNTSDAVLEVLSDHVRALCDEAIRSATKNERKTVMDRDYRRP
jgi:hypothetical protein